MSDFIIRTEELSDEQIKELYVPTQNDKKILEQLKSQSPVLLVGSRGVGKSFLSKISQINLMENFEKEKIFPVFITFRSVSLIQSGNSKDSYVENMKEMVTRQVKDSDLLKAMMINGQNFSILAYAAGGNPRLLLRSIEKIRSFNSNTINSVFREFYREEIWMEQSGLAEKYPGNSIFIDWGRKFVEEIVIPELKDKNDRFLSTNKSTTAYFWIHRNSPQAVKEALRILEYTGVIKQQALGIKATNAEIGTRYEVNIGCLLAFEANPQQKAMDIINNLSLGRMSEYGANSKAYNDLLSAVPKFSEPDMSECLKKQLSKSIKVLEITQWQKSKLVELNVKTIGELLLSTESKLMQAYYVGEVKARQMKNAAMAAVFEYLFG